MKKFSHFLYLIKDNISTDFPFLLFRDEKHTSVIIVI